MDSISEKLRSSKGVNTKKYCGTVKLNEDPLLVINIDDRIKFNTIEIKKTSNLKLPDSIIAAIHKLKIAPYYIG